MPRALIVDDHEENTYLLRALLGAHGYLVVVTRNGAEALADARRQPPDVIVSDVLMPVMDGFSLCRECKRDPNLAAVPFVFYTATYTDPKDEALALSLGADLFLVKPAEPEVLLEGIERVMRRRRERPPAQGPEPPPEEGYLRQYSEALVRKLEDKLLDLERANQTLALRGAVIEASVAGIALADETGRCRHANPSFARIFGRPAAELEGVPLLDFVAGEALRSTIREALAGPGCWVGQFPARRHDGTPIVAQGLLESVKGQDGGTLCLMLSCIDVTDRARMQVELQRTQRLESLNVFARSVAHDFNNLLTGLLGNVELGMRMLPLGSPALRHLEVAVATCERARSLTQRLQSFARGGPAERRCVDLVELLRECGQLSLSGSNVRLELQAAPDLAPVQADPNQLAQVFNNVLMNARQAMEQGGTVVVSAAQRPPKSGSGEASVEVTIRDEGPGIPDDVAPRIFDPFFTTKPGGTGLGLATSYWIVRDHGGEIWLANGRGGATFVVSLPASDSRPDAAGPVAAQDLSGRGRILLMDDEPVVRDTTRRMLSLAGYEVTTAADSGETLAAYERAASEGRAYDLALLEVTIRGGAGGLETLERLRSAHPDAAVMLTSGHCDERLVARAEALGCTGFIQKPYLERELLSRVKAAIGGR